MADHVEEYHIDVRDIARLHIAPLLDPTIKNERLFAYADIYNCENVLEIIHELRPDWKSTEVFKENRKCLMVIEPRNRTEQVLKKIFGRPGLI